MAKPRRKKRTHQPVSQDPSKKGDPKSFVFRRGRYGLVMADLEQDLRKVMAPHTAPRLRESKRNVLRDFVHIAGPLGVTHFLILTATQRASYLRIAKSPRGPTLTMRVHEYALMRDVAGAQPRPRAPANLWAAPPLLVMNNFGAAGGGSHLKLATTMFQNLFPTLNVTTVRLASCQRVVLLNHDAATGRIEFRHYAIALAPSGVSRGVKALVGGRGVPSLVDSLDVADFLTKSGYGSESEGEEAGESRVTLAQDLGRGNLAARQSRVQLQEVPGFYLFTVVPDPHSQIGPRMSLEVVKVEEGLCDGKVLFHAFEDRTAADVAAGDAKQEAARRAAAEKEARRKQQEENVKRKAAAAAAAKGPAEAAPSKPWWQQELDAAAAERRTTKAEDDAAAYREEVGEEPDAAFSAGAASVGGGRPGSRKGPAPRQQGRKQLPGEGMGGAAGVKKRKPGALRDRSSRGEKKQREGKAEERREEKKRRKEGSGGGGGSGSRKKQKGGRT